MRRFSVYCLIAAAAFAAFPLVAAASPRDYVIVMKGQGHGSTAINDVVTASGGALVAELEQIGVAIASSESPGFLDALARDARVKEVAADVDVPWIPDVRATDAEQLGLTEQGVNSEPYWGYQWNIRQIGADQTAADGDRGWGVVRARVAVLDSGIVSNHPDIAPNLNVSLSRSFVPDEPGIDPVVPGFNHGTHVAGIIAAPINNRGVQGVAPEAEIVAVKVLRSTTGSGAFSWIIQGILYAASIDADVINMSLGATFDRINQGGGGAGPLIGALNRAITHATAEGTLCVSAAGNDAVNLDGRLWAIPAQSGNGMAVSATGPIGLADFDRLASYSNYGRSVVNVAAPGGDSTLYPNPGWHLDMVLSPSGTGYYFASGTSMAAPHVSGLAALLVGKYGKTPPAQLKGSIERGADDILKPGADRESGRGRINAFATLQ